MFLRQSLVLSVLLSTALGSGKRGLAANDDVPISGFGGEWNGNPSQVTWQYNWDSDTKQKQDFAEFVPMLWGPANIHTAQWRTNAQWWVSNSAQHLLGFNEPEQQGQSNLSVSQAVDAWRDWMEDFSGVAKLGAPSVSNDGYEWLSQFLQACSGCHIDFIPIHWYNDHSIEFDLEDWVNKICDLGDGRPVWITEFQGFGSDDEQAAFLEKAIPFLDNNACVERYAYFGTADNSKVLLQNGGPSLSDLGVQYAFSPFGSGNGPA